MKPMTLKEIETRVAGLKLNDLGWMACLPSSVVQLMCEAAGIDSDEAAADAGFREWHREPRRNAVSRGEYDRMNIYDCALAWNAALRWDRERKERETQP